MNRLITKRTRKFLFLPEEIVLFVEPYYKLKGGCLLIVRVTACFEGVILGVSCLIRNKKW